MTHGPLDHLTRQGGDVVTWKPKAGLPGRRGHCRASHRGASSEDLSLNPNATNLRVSPCPTLQAPGSRGWGVGGGFFISPAPDLARKSGGEGGGSPASDVYLISEVSFATCAVGSIQVRWVGAWVRETHVVITCQSSRKSSPGSRPGPNRHPISSSFPFSLAPCRAVSFPLCAAVYTPGICNVRAPQREAGGQEGGGQALFSPHRALSMLRRQPQ